MIAYLDLLEGVLRTGLEEVGAGLKQAQTQFVLCRQQPQGGFPGRRGDADLYYTDFALRLLALVPPGPGALSPTARYLAQAPDPTDVIQCFNLLNAQRLLGQLGYAAHFDRGPVLKVLRRQGLGGGGFARPGASTASAYHTFLAALCYELLEDEEMPLTAQAAGAITALQGPDGGFRDQLSEGMEQTNATAAAAAFLLLQESLTEQQARRAVSFLSKLQAPDGGFLAHAAAPASDLLSTFTALATLAGLDSLERVNLGGIARFLRQTACPGGGFKAAPADTEPDIEYTYYGLGCLALLHAALA